MISIKEGVKIGGISPEMVLAATVIDQCFGAWGCVITSCKDGAHGLNSLHYQGKALDIRTRHVVDSPFPRALDDIVAKIKLRLGGEFDVVLEEDHLHVEFDPS